MHIILVLDPISNDWIERKFLQEDFKMGIFSLLSAGYTIKLKYLPELELSKL